MRERTQRCMRGTNHGREAYIPTMTGRRIYPAGARVSHTQQEHGCHIPGMYREATYPACTGRLHTLLYHPGYIHHLVYTTHYHTLGIPCTSHTRRSTGSSGLGVTVRDDEALGSNP